MSYGIILGGGTVLGAVQPPIVRAVFDEMGELPARIAGTSIGAVTASKAGQGYRGLDELDETWDSVEGTRFFQAVQIDVWNGLFSMRRLRRELDDRDAATRLQMPVYVGLVDVARAQHKMVLLNDLGIDDRRDAIIGSASQPFIHEHWRLQGRWVFDGGVAHVLPLLPGWENLEQIVVISCSPTGKARRVQRRQKDVAQSWEQAEVAFEMLINRVVRDDVQRLKSWADKVPVRLYAPESWEQVGRPFDASRETIARRRGEVAEWMLAHPTDLTRTPR